MNLGGLTRTSNDKGLIFCHYAQVSLDWVLTETRPHTHSHRYGINQNLKVLATFRAQFAPLVSCLQTAPAVQRGKAVVWPGERSAPQPPARLGHTYNLQ